MSSDRSYFAERKRTRYAETIEAICAHYFDCHWADISDDGRVMIEGLNGTGYYLTETELSELRNAIAKAEDR